MLQPSVPSMLLTGLKTKLPSLSTADTMRNMLVTSSFVKPSDSSAFCFHVINSTLSLILALFFFTHPKHFVKYNFQAFFVSGTEPYNASYILKKSERFSINGKLALEQQTLCNCVAIINFFLQPKRLNSVCSIYGEAINQADLITLVLMNSSLSDWSQATAFACGLRRYR